MSPVSLRESGDTLDLSELSLGGELYTCKMYEVKLNYILLVILFSGFHVSLFSQMFPFAKGCDAVAWCSPHLRLR